MTRTLSLLTPSGRLTLGSYLGALLPMSRRQEDAFYGVSDLHAMTTEHDPRLLRSYADETATLFLAVGLDRATLFRQSHVPAHAQLAYLLECVATTGELNRMIQFKEKGRGVDSTRVSLFTYPALMAADILLYRPEQVPVGADQRQHVELTRDLALRFNRRYGPVFTVPEVVTASDGTARVMDLLHPDRKMSKSADAAGSVYLLDPPDVVRRKVARAVTDSDTGAGRRTTLAREARRHQPARHPGGVRRLGRRHRHLRCAQARGHRRRRGHPGADPEAVRRPRRRPRARDRGLRVRRRPLPGGDLPGPGRGHDGDRAVP